ncbi:MAG TPA: hypothetical protein VE978_05940 [Chitinophagales bacterium]|nr:hypothetical protein [Chitinophagales bacterium]
MKAILFSIILLLTGLDVSGQLFYFGAGSNLSFTKPKPLDFIIQRYNETRTDCSVLCLSDEIENFRNISGVSVLCGYVGDGGLLLEAGWAGRNDIVTAQGTPAGDVLQQRDLKLRANTLTLGLGYIAGNEANVRPGINFSMDFGSLKTFSRAGEASGIKDKKYDEITKNVNLAFSIAGNLFFLFGRTGYVGLLLKPYYQLAVFDIDFSDLNAAINPATFVDDDLDSQKGKVSTYGITIAIILAGDGYESPGANSRALQQR